MSKELEKDSQILEENQLDDSNNDNKTEDMGDGSSHEIEEQVVDDENIAERCRSLRTLCFQERNRFVHEELGWNYRMTNLQAAVGLAQLERLAETVEKKRFIGRNYTENLSELEGIIQLPIEKCKYAENIYWVFGLVVSDGGEEYAVWYNAARHF